MKKITTLGMVAILFLTAVFAVSQTGAAQAANGPADVTVTLMNNTAGSVSLHLTGENGSFWLNVSEAGMSTISVPEGKYDYSLTTPCGAENGHMNINVAKVLKVFCDGAAELSVDNRAKGSSSACSVYGWWHGPGQSWGHWHADEDASKTPSWDVPENWELRCTDGDPTFGQVPD